MSSQTTTPLPLVDHIVILIPHSYLSAPPPWFADLFTFYPGGQHADGLTENTLALLADGSYIEFIAFVPGADPARRARHQWGRKHEGEVVDWAVTLPPGGLEQKEKTFQAIQQKVRDADTGIVYGDLVRGGRIRPDGEVLEWGVAFPKKASDGSPVDPGTVPFWCLDVTPRHLRVPYDGPDDSAWTKHPSGAVGVAGIHVTRSAETVKSAGGVYDVLLGKASSAEATTGWKIRTLDGEKVHSDAEVRLATSRKGEATVKISFFTDDMSLAGKTVGGKVNEEHGLEFYLAPAFGSE
ncbi:glyoxalase-like domain-containing protein [Hypoxylon fragiforme]|uniref:glyoxalase-like domain-containing protein n=1 Tax=Hypoxylon fragiforme TaxID=63214 RepID=UPI0020C693AE|nr:glyoxalase-like domain-containing protein [Hypoxylon fragiforme]KAI2603315.1 glyoxalase-like domain-containing protein [Hypoxylon fragiforme]